MVLLLRLKANSILGRSKDNQGEASTERVARKNAELHGDRIDGLLGGIRGSINALPQSI
jgi:hypothetical protein